MRVDAVRIYALGEEPAAGALPPRLERGRRISGSTASRSTSPTSSSMAPATIATRRCARRSPTRKGVTPDRVVMANGTSMANMLALAALIAPGDEVLVEHPTYEPMLAAARFLGAEVKRFERRRRAGLPARSRRSRAPRHAADPADPAHQSAQSVGRPRRRGDAAADRRARAARADRRGLSRRGARRRARAAHLGPHFVSTNSLTKVYGLSGLRCGWILAEPELAERIWRLNELFGVSQPHADERLCCLALDRLDEIAAGNAGAARAQPRRSPTTSSPSRDEIDWAPTATRHHRLSRGWCAATSMRCTPCCRRI